MTEDGRPTEVERLAADDEEEAEEDEREELVGPRPGHDESSETREAIALLLGERPFDRHRPYPLALPAGLLFHAANPAAR